jgi:tRNA(Ile)-lysidine synthase
MLARFQKYIAEQQLFTGSQKILLAVSGGVDSMVLWHLFEEAGLHYGIAHCNFQLRGDESDADEQLVTSTANKYGVQLHQVKFNTKKVANERGISIEMAARDLRYSWFADLTVEHNYDVIAVAHHTDDVLETFFLNLSRSTGIRGLSGIQPKNGNVVRPLLFSNREEIEAYAQLHQVSYRNDSSNNELIYQRNKVRHQVLPLLEELNPAFRKNMLRSISNLHEIEAIFQSKIEDEKQKIVAKKNNQVTIKIDRLKSLPNNNTYLYEWIKRYGFNSTVINEIIKSLDASSGKRFYSETHQLIKDREELIIVPLEKEQTNKFYIEKGITQIDSPINLQFEIKPIDEFQLIRNKYVACIDADLIEYPLMLSKWQQGQYFQPLGMTGFKKISDFFIDQKFTLLQKENAWILGFGKQVIWIVGHRLDNRFKVTDKTQRVLIATYLQ